MPVSSMLKPANQSLVNILAPAFEAASPIVFERQAYLSTPGSFEKHMYWVEKGCFRIFSNEDGHEQTTRFAYSDNVFALLDAFLTDQPTAFFVQALRKTTVRRISWSEFQGLLNPSDPTQRAERYQAYAALLENLVLQQMERERDVLSVAPAERYRRVLERSPQLFQEVPHKYIADYLRMTPETLSRIKNS
jgi:CRP-like cAMP-binding protein